MLVVKLVGGLASQLHKYAVGRALAERLNTELLLDTTSYQGSAPKEAFSLAVNHFHINARPASPEEIATAKGTAAITLRKLCRIIGQQPSAKLEKRVLRWFGHTQYKANITKEGTQNFFDKIPPGKNAYIHGEWGAGFGFFEDIRPLLLQEFQLKCLSEEALVVKKQIAEEHAAVSLHVRRGDYVSNPAAAKLHGTSPIDYYTAAVDHVQRQVTDPRFFVFSDDLAWCRKNLAGVVPHDTVFVEGFPGHEDFHLLSQCKHNIIANSGFSALSAWLNRNPDKLIVSPQQWFANEEANRAQRSQLPASWYYL
tara:strand:- start:11494 stop:12423 length:930 start_codon:yes stop_codon:yes gene_type:complete